MKKPTFPNSLIIPRIYFHNPFICILNKKNILGNIQKATPKNGTLIIVEALLDNGKNSRGNLGGAMFMPIVSRGKVRGLDEFDKLFNEVGLQRVHHAPVHDSTLSLSYLVVKKNN